MQRITTENITLKQRVLTLTIENRPLEEGLQAARSNNRIADRRIAQLEAQLAEHARCLKVTDSLLRSPDRRLHTPPTA